MPVSLVDTGPVDVGGEKLEEHLLCFPAGMNCVISPPIPDPTNGALSAEVLNATVVAQGNQSRAAVSVAEVNLNVAGHQISATLLQARAVAQCNNGTAFVRGEADIVSLTIDKTPMTVTGEVNQEVPLPNDVGLVILNEQVATLNAGNGDITVRALHLKVDELNTDVVIAEAHADILCGQRFCPTDKDFVTGGGRLDNSRNFAVAGGIRNGAGWGHLLYINHATRVKAKGTGVTAYTVTGPTSRHIEGNAEINGMAGTYMAEVDDKGEPGVGRDTFTLVLSNGETAGGTLTDPTLTGGNIQLHTCK